MQLALSSFSPLRAARIIEPAQPTPLSTDIAPTGQLSWHAPHSMHAEAATSSAFVPFWVKTLCGQTVLHLPQPTHLSLSYWIVVSW